MTEASPVIYELEPGCRRYACVLGYVGTQFSGWQLQPSARTVQGEVEDALTQLCGKDIRVFCAGRTDAGVHALGQVIHFDSPVVRSSETWFEALNALTPRDIQIKQVLEVDASFHARFSACARSYTYLIDNSRPGQLWWQEKAWHIPYTLSESAMQEATACWLGEHDFSAFRSSQCQSNTPNRCVESFSVERQGDWVIVRVKANAFLHHMVRNFLGVLAEIGGGKRPIAWSGEVLDSRDRCRAGVTAPPQGLYFHRVFYDTEQVAGFHDPEWPFWPSVQL